MSSASSSSSSSSSVGLPVCAGCGSKFMSDKFKFCPFCGKRRVDLPLGIINLTFEEHNPHANHPMLDNAHRIVFVDPLHLVVYNVNNSTLHYVNEADKAVVEAFVQDVNKKEKQWIVKGPVYSPSLALPFVKSIQPSVSVGAIEFEQQPEVREKILRTVSTLYDSGCFLGNYLRNQEAVAQIFNEGRANATGFMISGTLLLTNYHVINRAEFRNGRFEATFLDGTRARVRQVIVEHSGLDFCIAEIDTRRAVCVPLASARVAVIGERLLSLQHAGGRPLQIAFIGDITTVTTDDVQYTVDTERGSSGSPMFDHNWNLVALHKAAGSGDFNRGTPIKTIVNRADVQAALAAHP